jgi:regulatory protein
MKPRSPRKQHPPLDQDSLERAALNYAGRYATTRAKLIAYLERKLRERGWSEPNEPPIARLAERMFELGYVDDRAFASARAEALGRRGYGPRRVRQALRAAGVAEEDAAEAQEEARRGAWEAALRFARRRRIGPFATSDGDHQACEKALAALLRAGHPTELARRLAYARPGEIPDADGG